MAQLRTDITPHENAASGHDSNEAARSLAEYRNSAKPLPKEGQSLGSEEVLFLHQLDLVRATHSLPGV